MGELFKIFGECWVELFLLKFWGDFKGGAFNIYRMSGGAFLKGLVKVAYDGLSHMGHQFGGR